MAEPRVARFLLRLFPSQWRARYGLEFEALLSQTGISIAIAFDIALSAIDAHIHPSDQLRRWSPMTDRLRRSELVIFVCWVVVAVAGSGFAKLTEDPPLRIIDSASVVPSTAYDIVYVAAVASVIGLVVAGLPIAVAIVIDALRRRRWSQLVLLAVPALAVLGWLSVTALLAGISFAITDDGPRLIALAAWIASGIAAVAVSCLALGLAALNSQIDGTLYRRAINPARLVVAGMVGVTLAIAGWGIALLVTDPYDFWGVSGLLATSTALTWVLIVVLSGAATVAALRAVSRLGAPAA